MNLGVYVKTLEMNEELSFAIDNINKGIDSGELTDASIFFDEIGYNETPISCGCFNAADMWGFTGTLVVTSIENAQSAISIVNKFKVLYYYNWNDERNIMGIISIASNPNVTTICRSTEDSDQLYRITGIKSKAVVDNFNLSDILKAMSS